MKSIKVSGLAVRSFDRFAENIVVGWTEIEAKALPGRGVVVNNGGKDPLNANFIVQQVLDSIIEQLEPIAGAYRAVGLTYSTELKPPHTGSLNLSCVIAASLAVMNKTFDLSTTYFIGGVDPLGRLCAIRGACVMAKYASDLGATRIICEESLAPEINAAVREEVAVFPVSTVVDALLSLTLQEHESPKFTKFPDITKPGVKDAVDMEEVKLDDKVRRALCVAVATHRPILLLGSDGEQIEDSGYRGPVLLPRSLPLIMIARRIATLLPTLHGSLMHEYDTEAVHRITRIRSLAGLDIEPCDKTRGVAHTRPFRAPHYTVSLQGLVGAPNTLGEVVLASGGVLYLDELQEFPLQSILELKKVLKQMQHPPLLVGGLRYTHDPELRKRRIESARALDMFDFVVGPENSELLTQTSNHLQQRVTGEPSKVTRMRLNRTSKFVKPAISEIIATLQGRDVPSPEDIREANKLTWG